jgi:hypothetical protein
LQPHKSVAERLSDFYRSNSEATKKQQIQGKSLSVPLNNNNNNSNSNNTSTTNASFTSGENFNRKQALCRTTSNVQTQSQQHLVPPPNLSLHNSPQQHQQQYRLAPGQALSASTSPTNNMMPHMHQKQQQQFPKSHSIDNLPREMYQQKPVSYSNNNLWNQQQQQKQPQSSELQSQIDNVDMSLNLHKKLQRQLSLLNPYDPRLYPMQQQQQQQQKCYPQTSANAPDLFLSSSPAHKPLSTSHSLTGGAQNLPQHSIYEHQVRKIY